MSFPVLYPTLNPPADLSPWLAQGITPAGPGACISAAAGNYITYMIRLNIPSGAAGSTIMQDLPPEVCPEANIEIDAKHGANETISLIIYRRGALMVSPDWEGQPLNAHGRLSVNMTALRRAET